MFRARATKHNSPYNCERAGSARCRPALFTRVRQRATRVYRCERAIVNIFFAAQKRKAEGRDAEHGENEQEFTDFR